MATRNVKYTSERIGHPSLPEHFLHADDIHKSVLMRLGKQGLLLGSEHPYIRIGENNYVVVGPHTRIDKSVFIDRGVQTAITIDVDTDKPLRNAYTHAAPVFERIADDESRRMGLRALATLIARSYLPYNQQAVADIYHQDMNRDSGLVPRSLGSFIEAGVGMCAQQALMASVILEKAIDHGTIGGEVHFHSIANHKTGDAHAFIVYTDENGLDWIVDPAADRKDCALTTQDENYDYERYGI